MKVNNFTSRYCPNSRFNGPLGEQFKIVPKYERFGESITDKEAYRLSLIGSSTGGASPIGSGSYAFPDGKYDPTKDISYILRPDLSPVQIDAYLKEAQKRLESADSELELKIKSDIEKFEAVKAETVNKNSNEGGNS